MPVACCSHPARSRWKRIAEQVIRRRINSGIVNEGPARESLELVAGGDAVGAFRLLWKIHRTAGRPAGWNKVWTPGGITGWYGPTVTHQPLRAAASEVEADPAFCNELRAYLMACWGVESPELAAEPSPPARNLLRELDIEPGSAGLSGEGLQFLRRLNLDRRELPLIERWRWATSAGLAILSDGARTVGGRDTVWARAIDAELTAAGGLSEPLKEYLRRAEPGAVELFLPNAPPARGPSTFWGRMEFYGYGRLVGDRLVLSVPAGKFPALALKLWE